MLQTHTKTLLKHLDIHSKRKKERLKYYDCYQQPSYRMGNNRKKDAFEVIKNLRVRGSFLDVGAGRGETVRFARESGFSPVAGVEVVDYLLGDGVVFGEAHNLPFEDNSFDVVASFDVFEHLLPEDTELALKEVSRVAKKAIILCIPNTPSHGHKHDLHINLRPFSEWHQLIDAKIQGQITVMPNSRAKSKTWIIDRS